MFRSGFILTSDAHIEAAMFNKSHVTVWMQDKIVDYGGVIQEYNELAVKLNNYWHPRKISDGDATIYPCEFRIR